MNLVYGWCVERVNPDKREEWDSLLTAALPGQEKARPTEQQAADEGSAFMATMAMHAARTTAV
jgi:hypothetical protein